jgi:protein dithiol:quinone oxidoreductase
MKFILARIYYFIGLFLSIAMLGFAVYLQEMQNIIPCSLCELQRIAMAIIGLLYFLASFLLPTHKSKRNFFYAIGILSFIGILLATRQIYLQHFPPAYETSCIPGLSYLINTFSLSDALIMALQGTQDCAQRAWAFLGVELSVWTLIGFVMLGLLPLLQIKKGD